TPWCSLGCRLYETAHHLFVTCSRFDAMRGEACTTILSETKKILDNSATLEEEMVTHLLMMARNLFTDHEDTWPLHLSRYYLGTLPPLPYHASGTVETRRLTARIYKGWHSIAIRLAGRIWGEYKRLKRTPFTRPAQSSTDVTKELPDHLRYLS
ncbi:hypothetical protein L218DRAFT_883808, partial [Marasmius fiardii PR-910]